ncbi:MAG: GNAT family acetyltransferase [Chloroflexi bacterium]|nr:GNAT family acetyltransferase [Chloroflexota bacterium]
MELREFTLDDYDVAFALWQDSAPGIGLSRSDTRDEIAKKLQRDPDLFLVATDDGKLIGTVFGGYDGRRGLIYHLAVARVYRGNGLGKILMAEVEKRMAAKGCLKSYLLVKRENEDVIEFYQGLGWDVMDITIMGKNLDAGKKEMC